MSWNLQIVPKGLLLSKYVKNSILMNPNNVSNIEMGHILSDQYQSYNPTNNTVNIEFQLSLYNSDPLNDLPPPDITGISALSITNDPNSGDIFVLTPTNFVTPYSLSTDYICDLSTLGINSLIMPASSSVTFSTVNGSGNVIIKNWPLSGSSGIKRVFISLNVLLSNGNSISFPAGIQIFDEIIVSSGTISSPNIPILLGKTPNNFASYPLYFRSDVASNSGDLSVADSGISAYFWDGLILNSTSNIVRNNYSQGNIQLFDTVSPNYLNQDKLPIIFTSSASLGIGATAAYNSYVSNTGFSLTPSNNIYFFENFVSNISDTLGYVYGPSFFYEFNITNSTGSIKYIRQQIIFDETFVTLTVITSIDDQTWSSDSGYIPSANHTTVVITNPSAIAQITQSGVFSTLVELVDSVSNVYQIKLLFRSDNTSNNIVINEMFFASTLLTSSTSIFGEFRSFIQNSSSVIILESNQYGICQGTLSASVMPTDKILTNNSLFVQNSTDSIYVNANNSTSSEQLNTWYTISNSQSSGVLSDNVTYITLFNNQINNAQNNLSAVEIQSNVPTFSEDSTITSAFQITSTANPSAKIGYSFDSNLDYPSFVFSDLLKTNTGIYLPQQTASYDFIASLSWSGANQFNLNVFDVGSAQTCSISTTITNNLFFYSKSNSLGILQSPTVVRTISGISSSNTFNTWIGTNGFSTSVLITQSAVIKNQGQTPISVNTGLGLSTVAPGQPYVVNGLSVQSSNPTSFIISTNTTTVTSSINFVYDFGQLGYISALNISIQVATPPDCLLTLPTIQYSVEFSADFINWNFESNINISDVFNPGTGNLTITFSNASDLINYRYARLRIYYNASATFDPRLIWRYSLCSGTQTPATTVSNKGKLIFGFTDTSAKNNSLGQFYNQPTYLRKFLPNASKVTGIVFDFTDYRTDNSVFGPVYINLLTESSENRIYTITSNFALNTVYSLSFSIQRRGINDAFKLQPSIAISGGSLSPINIALDDILIEPSDISPIVFGYYPFISLVGSGDIQISSAIIKGTYNHGLNYQNNETYFSILSAEDTDYTANYGKNLLFQNSFGITTFNYPNVNSYFLYNQITKFDYNNVTFTVKAVATDPISLYGLTYTDGISLSICDYVLVAGQLDKTTNGVYQVQQQQWSKQNPNPGNSLSEPTVLVTQGNILGDTLWMQDNLSTEWISNAVCCPFVLNDNVLLSTGISSVYKYPQYIKLGVGQAGTQSVNSLNQVKIKLVNSPFGVLSDTDNSTQWNSLLQNNQLYSVQEKSNSNNTIWMNYAISSSQIAGITTSIFPAIYNLIVTYSGNYIPVVSQNSYFNIGNYGSKYRIFNNNQLAFQMFSTYEKVNIGTSNTSIINTSVYGLNLANLKSPQSGFSSDITIDSLAPVVGILSIISNDVKSVAFSLSSAYDSGSGLQIARIVQRNPANELIYGSWFGFNTNSFTGISSIVAYPSYIANLYGITTGEPLSGYYKYNLQISDSVGNVTQTNQVANFYYESAIIDTQGPSAAVSFVGNDNTTPISITTSSVVTALLNAKDSLSNVKAFRYKILPSGDFGNWIDYDQYTSIFLPSNISDGSLSLQFQFKDFGNNVLYSDSTITNDQIFVYTWSIVSRLIAGTMFTVVENTTYNNANVLIIGASKNNSATLFIWNNSKLIELQYPGFSGAKAVTALKSVNNSVVIGTDNGWIFVYQNGAMSGPYARFQWGSTPLPISKFEVHQYPQELKANVYATTLNIPRIFRTAVDNLNALSWQVVQPNPIAVTGINVLNTGLWSGNVVSFSISSSYQLATLTPVLNYGISSIIVAASGSNYPSAPVITINGPIVGASLSAVMQGKINNLNLLRTGFGYTNGVTISISAPAPGGVQAVGYAITNSLGQIISIGLTSQGVGYTSQNPTVIVSGVNGIGSQAVISASVIFNSIYAVNVVSTGIATTTNISLSVSGNASLIPTFLYNVASLTVTNPGYGYTSNPVISINGITTIATAIQKYGSVQSASVIPNTFTFPISQPAIVSVVGGVSTNWVGIFNTSGISFTTGLGLAYSGTVLNSISIISGGYGLGTIPTVSFTTSINGPIYAPELQFVLSDNLILFSGSGSIYDIKSFDSKLFITNSNKDIVQIDYKNNVFSLTGNKLNTISGDLSTLTPVKLETYNSGISTSLMFTVKEAPFVGVLKKAQNNTYLSAYQNNTLLFKPYNFDIISNWQLIKILNTNGIATINYGDSNNSTVLISNINSQVFYESTRDNTWFNRCVTNNNYSVTFNFSANYGTQSAEIANFNSMLRITFTVSSTNLSISFGDSSYSTVVVSLANIYNITFVKNNNDIYVYNNTDLVFQQANFIANKTNYPVIKFGYMFEPQQVIFNSNTLSIFGLPAIINPSSFIWNQIKISFTNNAVPININSYELNLPYVLPNATNVSVLKNVNNNIYAVTKSISDLRTSTNISDIGSKVYRLDGSVWNDVTGNFESFSAGISTTYIISSPNDINALGNSYFVTGLIKPMPSRKTQSSSILLGLSTNIFFEEQQNISLTIIYPYNPTPSGQFLTITNNNGMLNIPGSVYMPSGTLVNVVSIGVAATFANINSIISVTDGITTSTITTTIIPIGISTIGINTASFVGYSVDTVIANVQLQSKPQTDRIIFINSSNNPILSAPANGIATIKAGNNNVNVTLNVGSPVTTPNVVNITALYRSSISTTLITANPFILSIGLSTSSFVGNELYKVIIGQLSVQRAPIGILTAQLNSSISTALSVPSPIYFQAGSISTALPFSIGSAVIASNNIAITGIVTGSIATANIIVSPFIISTATVDFTNPVLGLQTSTVTFTLNTTPANNVIIKNVVTSSINNLIFAGFSTVYGGGLTTSFGISTTLSTYAAGIAITVRGAPFGFNTTPNPGLTLFSDIWRIKTLTVSPNSIVGGGANANGIAQSYLITATLNAATPVGLATTVVLSSTFNGVVLNNITFGAGTITSSSFATGLTTSLISGFAITGSGPNGFTSIFSGLTMNPFLISSFTTTYIWGGNPSANGYTVGGVGATVIGTITLNAYPLGIAQTAVFSTISNVVTIASQTTPYPIIGYATVNPGFNSTTINFGVGTIVANLSTTVTAMLLSSSLGIGTTTINAVPFPGYNVIFDPVISSMPYYQYSVNLNGPLPVTVGFANTFNNGFNQYFGLAPNQIGYSTINGFTSFAFDTTFIAQTLILGVLQTYYVTGYAKSGTAFGMGYNSKGQLGAAYPTGGSANKSITMGLSSVVKVASGYSHNIALDAFGRVFGIGDNTYGQLGYYNQSSLSTSNFLYISAFNGIKARDIMAQNNTSYVILANNYLYSFGDNTNNSLGTSVLVYPASLSTYIPQLISTSVQLCSVYNSRGTIVSYNNSTGIQSVFEFGNNLTGIVGKGITQLTYLGIAKSISNLVISNVDTGPNHTIAAGTWIDSILGVTSMGIFAWGNNANYQIGTQSTVGFVTTPNVLHKFTPSGIVPIEFSNLIFADYNFSMIVGAGNTIYQVGTINSANNSGTGLAQTAIANTFNGFSTNSSIYKVAKDQNHYLWTIGLGSVYVSGGANNTTATIQPLTYSNPTNEFLYSQNAIPSYSQHAQIVYQSLYLYWLETFGGTGSFSLWADGLKLITGSYRFNGSILDCNPSNVWGGMLIPSTVGGANIVQFSNASSNLYTSTTFGWPNNIIDITISGKNLNYSYFNAFALSYVFGGPNQVKISWVQLFDSLTPPINHGTATFTNYLNPALIDGAYVTNYRASGGATTFNLLVGYVGGLVELYGDTTPGSISLISSWSLGNTITCLKSIMFNFSPNTAYVFIATADNFNGVFKLYRYQADGGASQTTLAYNQSILGGLNITIPSTYGPITLIQMFSSGRILCGTQANYLLIIDTQTLNILAAVAVRGQGGAITSITYSDVPQDVTLPGGVNEAIFVTTKVYGGGGSAPSTTFAYYMLYTPNYEYGLNYANPTGSYQLMTYDGSQTGVGVSNIFHASTNDTFSVILDSLRPNI